MTFDGMMNKVEDRPKHLSVRRQRIERWAYKGRSVSMNDPSIRSGTALGTSLIQKRSESSLTQADRRLNMDLFQLGSQREKLLERHNFDQKLFANKQALRHKNNPDVQRTLDYVRKCCKFSMMQANEEEFIDPSIFLEENRSNKPIRSRPVVKVTSAVKQKLPKTTSVRKTPSLTQTFLQYNRKYVSSSSDEESEKRHVQFCMQPKRGSQSAHVSRKSPPSEDTQRSKSAQGIRTINSAPARTRLSPLKKPIRSFSKSKRPSSRIFCTKTTLQEFRRYPERFLSQSNRYLPLLHRHAMGLQATELANKHQTQSLSRFSDESDFTYEDVKSFLSEDIETGKTPILDGHVRQNSSKLRAPNKINLMESGRENSISEHTRTLSRLRDREYAHLQSLIRSNSIDHILRPLSTMKSLTSRHQHQSSMDLNELLHSNESLDYTKTRKKPKQNSDDIEKNRSKFGILIF